MLIKVAIIHFRSNPATKYWQKNTKNMIAIMLKFGCNIKRKLTIKKIKNAKKLEDKFIFLILMLLLSAK